MPIRLTVAGVDLTFEKLLWRAYGRRGATSEMLAATLAANPGLAVGGPVLPLGTPVTLPDLIAAPAKPRRRVVNLFED